MSFAAMALAWDQHVEKPSAKLVLMCLADCHNQETGQCSPSHGHIAKQTCLNIKTVPAAIGYLEEMGLITVQRRDGFPAEYELHLVPGGRGSGGGGGSKPAAEGADSGPRPPRNRGTPKTGYPKNGSKLY